MGREKFRSKASAAPQPPGPPTFDKLVKEGLELHDRAEKKRGGAPDAACALFRESLERYNQAEGMLTTDESIELHYNMGVAFGGLASCLRELETRNSASQADDALQSACERYECVVRMDESHSEALNNWGAALTQLAESKGGEEAGRLLELAAGKLEAGLSIAPNDVDATNNLGDTLSSWAQLVAPGNWERASQLWQGSYQRYEMAFNMCEYPSDRVDTLSNWSHALSNHAEVAKARGDAEGAASLYDAGAERLKAILQINPSDADGYVACAEAIKSAAELRPGGISSVYGPASEALQAALRIDSNHQDALAALGELCLDSGRDMLKAGRGPEGLQLLGEGWQWYQRLLTVVPGDGDALYNSACLHSLAGNIAEAMQCLSGARQSEESKDGGAQLGAWIKSVVEDADFAPLHAVPEFAVIVTAPVGLGM